MVSLQRDEGVVLRRTRWSETSLMVTLLTRGHGKVGLAARGALRSGAGLGAVLDLGHRVDVVWSVGRKGGAHLLREAELREPFLPVEPVYAGVQAAGYFCALLEAAALEGEACPELFDLACRALGYLGRQAPKWNAVLHFERELARVLGILGRCGGELDAAEALREYLGRLPAQRDGLERVLSGVG